MRVFVLCLLIAMAAGACDGTFAVSVKQTDAMTMAVDFSEPDGTKFMCIESGRNPCYFLTYTTTCVDAKGPDGMNAKVCTKQLFEQFTVAEGDSHQISGTAKLQYCVSNQAPPVLQKCAGEDAFRKSASH
jgi:hypothetical protein